MGSGLLGRQNSAQIGSISAHYAFYVRDSPFFTRNIAVVLNPHPYSTSLYLRSTVLRPVGCTDSVWSWQRANQFRLIRYELNLL